MDQRSGNDASQSQSSDHSSTVSNPSLALGAGQQASILQVGSQAFLILTTGQLTSPLQGLGLNLVPVGGPDASLLETGEPQAQLLQVGGVQPSIGQIGESKPLLNQTERRVPSIASTGGPQPAIVQVGPDVQPQTAQANVLRFKPSQSISPLYSTIQAEGLQSSLVQGGYTVPSQSATLQTNASKIKNEPELEDSVQSGVTQAGGAMLSINQVGRSSHIDQIGGLVTSSVQLGSTFPSEIAKIVPLPTSQVKFPSIKEKTFHQPVAQDSGAMPPLSHTGRFQPNIVQFSGLRLSLAQDTSAVPTQAEFCQADAKIKTEPGLEDVDIKPPTIEAIGQYAENANLIGLGALTVQSSLFQPSLEHTHGLHSLSVQENTKKSVLTKKKEQSLMKKGPKCQQDAPKYVDVACSAYNLVKMRHSCTNTPKKNKSIGTQVKMSLRRKSQAVQFPESTSMEPDVPTYQECSSQAEEFFWPGQLGFRQNNESHPYKVVIVQDPEPEKVSVLLSETSHGDREHACNMEGVAKWLHGSYEAEHPHFDDVAIYFSEEEWACLNNKEKNIYKKVMMDNYWNLMAVGKISVKPPVITKIEKGEEPCTRRLQQADHKQFPDTGRKDNSSRQNIVGERYNIQRFYERLKMITTPIRLSMAGMTVTRIMSDPSFCEPPHKIRDPSDRCPFKPYLKAKPVINERPFRCFKCERTFKGFGNLSHHYQRAHQSEQDLSCSTCGKKFSNMKALLLHYMGHRGDRPFICRGCGRSFTSQVCLNKHYILNSKKKYECLECGKQFGVKHSLIKHEKLHQMDNHDV